MLKPPAQKEKLWNTMGCRRFAWSGGEPVPSFPSAPGLRVRLPRARGRQPGGPGCPCPSPIGEGPCPDGRPWRKVYYN
ncbi:helix-turn-helix domain-containing protein [Thermoflexus sp.]|uniref:helix-turn-helix domain-containing protein n=1 Tax=Thermoflexus sp. TaxID=1969742 RepID=UPI003A102724